MQLEIRRDQRRREFGIGSGTGASTPDLRGNIMQLLAVLVGNDGPGSGTGIGCDLRGSRGNVSSMVFICLVGGGKRGGAMKGPTYLIDCE